MVVNKKIQVLIALGNPGSRYAKTRHNAAWLWVDHHFPNLDYGYDKYGDYEYAETSLDDTHLIIIKPQTFMNHSGKSVAYAMRKYGVTESDLVVVHDEVDLEIGQSKYSCNRGEGGHNGIKSINQHIGNKNYCRLRLGVRPVEISPSVKADTYVLGRFREEELEKLCQVNKVEVS